VLTVAVEQSALPLYQHSALLKWRDHIKAVHSKLRSASRHLVGCSHLIGCAHDAASRLGVLVLRAYLAGL